MEKEIMAARLIMNTGYDDIVQVLEKETIQLNRTDWAVCLDGEGRTVFLNVATGDLLLNGGEKVF